MWRIANDLRGNVDGRGFIFPHVLLFANVRATTEHDENLIVSEIGSGSEGDLKGLFDRLRLNSNEPGNSVPRRSEKLESLVAAI